MLIFVLPLTSFIDRSILQYLWDPGVLTNPRTYGPGRDQFCSQLPAEPPTIALALRTSAGRPGFHIYTAAAQMPSLFRAILDSCQMSPCTITNLNGAYGNGEGAGA